MAEEPSGLPQSCNLRAMPSSANPWKAASRPRNPGAERTFGYTAAEMLGRPSAPRTTPERAADETNILPPPVAIKRWRV